MRIAEPRFLIQHPTNREEGIAMLRQIEACARISHMSEERQTADSWERFIRAVVLQKGDWSVAEHVSVSVKITMNRGISHETVRHRLFSYTQSSTRFINYGKAEPEYIPSSEVTPADFSEWCDDLRTANDIYLKWLKRGYTPQIARDHLPNALATSLIVTGNLRNWRWFFLARTTKEAHPDMKRVTIPMLAEFKEKIPILFEDIEADARQIENARKAH